MMMEVDTTTVLNGCEVDMQKGQEITKIGSLQCCTVTQVYMTYLHFMYHITAIHYPKQETCRDLNHTWNR